jgi:D-hexose-6-phosphate mutarotase
MTSADIAALNERFGLQRRLRFAEGKSGMIKAELSFDQAKLELYLQGAHITRYQPAAGIEVLWMSDSALYQPGKALRGGIPLCWPWFGAHADNSAQPQHGYARTSQFQVSSTIADQQSTSITLTLDAAQAPWPDWKNRAALEFEIHLSDVLWMEMRSHNLSASTLTLSNALHSYFAISQRQQATIPAVTRLTYLDKLQNYLPQQQTCEITFDSEVDRIYQTPPASIDLLDQGHDINTSIESWGNNNLVIWNPGEQKARQMNDFDDRGFEQMICIEPANALAQSITLLPGEHHRLGQTIKINRH